MSKRALIVGAGGQLAQALIAAAPPETECIGRTRLQLDLCDGEAIKHALRETRPALVVNGAAYNQVDLAEAAGMEAAFRTNALGVGRLAYACREADTPLLHFSTDLVFDGGKLAPYTEDDEPRPQGVYAASKLAGEHLALAASPRNLVVRVCRLFGPPAGPEQGSAAKPSGNFPLLMLRLARERGRVRVVNDQIGSPTYTPDLAGAVWALTQCGDGGLFHLSSAGSVSFADYAREIFRVSGVPCEVEAVSSADYGAAARRPLYSVLDNSKAHAAGVTPLRDWQEALEECLTTLHIRAA